MGNMKDFPAEKGESTADNYGKGMILGIIAGGALGAALALLFAPKSGRELRYDIAELTNAYADRTGTAVNDASEKARQIVNDGRRRADTIIEDARQRASSLLTDAERIVNDARHRAQNAAGKTADDVREKADKLADAARAGVTAFRDELKQDPGSSPIAGEA